jgi:hypothetical protein
MNKMNKMRTQPIKIKRVNVKKPIQKKKFSVEESKRMTKRRINGLCALKEDQLNPYTPESEKNKK